MTTRSQAHKKHVQGITSNGDTTRGPFAPQVLTAPTISGTATNGSTLTGTNGTFTTAGPTPTVTRAWLRDGVVISGQTGATYVLGSSDVGHKITFRNIATSTLGTTNNDSAPTATVT